MKNSLLGGLVSGVAITLFTIMPSFASADTLTLSPTALLPQNATCAPIQILDVRTFVYDEALHSFEFVVSDSSYVAVGGNVGATSFPFNQISRSVATSGPVRIHVDIETTSLAGSLPVQVALLSSKGAGAPVCATTFSFVIPPTTSTPTEVPTTPVVPVSSTQYPPQTSYTPTNTIPSSHSGSVDSGKSPVAPGKGHSFGLPSIPTITIPTVAGITSAFTNACSTERGASNIWAILLVLYALFVAYCALTKPGILLRSAELLAAAIVLPFVGLVLFWYFSHQCRAGEWVQLLTPAIALVGLAIAFWEEKGSESTGKLPL